MLKSYAHSFVSAALVTLYRRALPTAVNFNDIGSQLFIAVTISTSEG